MTLTTDRGQSEGTTEKVTLMLSGGLDSVVLAHDLHAQGKDVTALHFRFSSKHGMRALESARRTCDRLGIPLHVVGLDGVAEVMSAVMPPASLTADECDTANEDAADVPSAMLFLPSVAAFYTQAAHRDAIYLGVIAEQARRLPGIMTVLEAMPGLIAGLNPRIGRVEAVAPYATRNKAEVIRRGAELGVDLETTWSCTDATLDLPCGQCNACRERRLSFVEAGVTDRTDYVG